MGFNKHRARETCHKVALVRMRFKISWLQWAAQLTNSIAWMFLGNQAHFCCRRPGCASFNRNIASFGKRFPSQFLRMNEHQKRNSAYNQ
eukprot:3742258-Amphidinium_carterae.1